MQVIPSEEVTEKRQALFDRLSSAVTNPDYRVYVVLDGALLEGLPDRLAAAGVAHRSLYRDSLPAFRVAEGPWLADLYHRHITNTYDIRDDLAVERDVSDAERQLDPVRGLEAVLDLLTAPYAAVFWIGDASLTEDSLFRHLRTINKVLVPNAIHMDRGKSYDVNPLSEDPPPPAGAHQLVIFRHCDANALAQVLPAIDDTRLGKLFGPAQHLLLYPDFEWGDGIVRVDRPAIASQPASGPLTMTADQITAMEYIRARAAQRRRMLYLCRTCPDETRGVTVEAVAAHILFSEQTGRDLGLISEGAHCRWAFLMCKTNGRILKTPEALDFISKQGTSPDAQIKAFMRGIIDAMKARQTVAATA